MFEIYLIFGAMKSYLTTLPDLHFIYMFNIYTFLNYSIIQFSFIRHTGSLPIFDKLWYDIKVNKEIKEMCGKSK